MNANEFVTKLKANNTAEDISDLVKVFEEYNVILEQLQQKDRAPFSLNVLCILCSIDCIRETRGMERSDRVKTLACIYHIHRHVVRQDSLIPPELVLKVSFMPFELEAKHLLSEYSKTYWNILVDRLSYIERLRYKIPIIKLLPKVIEDALKIIEIYDTLQFCNSALVFLVKKLHFLYSDKYPKELNQIFTEIFIKLSTKDMKAFKKLQEKELIGIYMKLNECLYVIAENASKTSFKDSPLDKVVRTCITIVGHSPDLFHCLQTFYSNTFCCILTKNTDLKNCETVLDGLLVSFERTIKLGYKTAMIATYPFLNQFLRLYIEHHVTNCDQKPWKDNFNIEIQKICLKLIQVLMQRLKNCNQMLKCDNCQVKSGLHDGLRLSFLVKHFITVSLSQNILLTDILPIIYDIINHQYKILAELRDLGCVNYEKCFRKLQTDVHNTAISLNKAQYYEFSTKFFDVYLTYEINQPQLSDSKNISRALYNKSICELDSKVYENALIDAFLSLVYSKEALSSEKYMSLVMDIKAKELKSKEDDEADDEADDDSRKESLQLFSVLNACERALGKKMYGNIKPFLMDLKFR
ncbi:Uncharacterized protein OBRU01_06323 [Operophtera brumata]|uniref:Uncharacterized protein n=1 Tax=Operophtera brumata TaxID=104452 RepID=A0A0L7LD14_OPEBR|nr:Uncharacterized protein OBRU01_06323 [Operophtera brumata]